MKNCKITVNKTTRKVNIEFDLDESYGDSKSGRTTIVASSEGPTIIDPDIPDLRVNFQAFRKKPKG